MNTFKTPVLFALLALLIGTTTWLTACGKAHHSRDYATSNTPDGKRASEGALAATMRHPAPGAPVTFDQGDGKHSAIALAQPGDDIWIIVKPPKQDKPTPRQISKDDHPGAGAMIALVPPTDDIKKKPTTIPLPLKHTDVKASVAGYIATVDVTQQFHNPYDTKIEAVYQFPLPQDSAVSEFVMEVGPKDDRRQIRGIIREKEQAKKLYNEARAMGLNAALLTQVRPNIFEQKVANIEPGKQIDVQIRYFNTLSYHDGWYSFVFPMTVGPRFNPPNAKDPVHAAPRGATPQPNGTTVTYLRPNERSGHDIALSLTIDAGVKIEESQSPTHGISASKPGDNPNKLAVKLAPGDRIPNKDFIFAFRVVGEKIKSGLVTHVDEKGKGYFSLMLYPPAGLKQLERQPMEMVFVLDCSGSMSGEPMAQSKAAMRHALKQLKPTDTFQIVRFSSNASQLGAKPLPATKANIRRALRYVDSLQGRGGTMMVEGIKTAFGFPEDDERYRVVTFMTDGKIGNEKQILAEMQKRIGEARVFSFGVGSSVNRFLLERMAKVGRGAAAYLLPGNSGEDVMDLYFERISHPAMTDVTIDWGGAKVAQVYPQRTPDLLVGRPVILTGRFGGELGSVRVSGKAGGKPISFAIDLKGATQHDALDQVWARRKIAEAMDRMTIDGEREWQQTVLDTALEYSLVSQYTAFLAVDASRITEGEGGTTVLQPVRVPEGVKYENTVGNE